VTPDAGFPGDFSTDAPVRNVLVEYPNGIKLRLGGLTVEAASRLLRELGQASDPASLGPVLPSVEEVRAYLEIEARVKPIKTSEIHTRFLGRRYYSRHPDKPTYNAMKYRLTRAREAINASPEWECIVAMAEDGSGEDAWFIAKRGG
jgi:hypothetical protein